MNFPFLKSKSSTFFPRSTQFRGKRNTGNPQSLLWLFQKVLDKQTSKKSGFAYKQELIIKQGREQLKSLVKKGLGVPVVLL